MLDRRVQKTTRALHQALISLIVEQGYEATTVQHILDRANVGRSTFYTHYNSKEHLLQGGLEELRKMLLAEQRALRSRREPSEYEPFAFSHRLFEHVDNYRLVYRAMVGKSAGAIVLNRMQNLLTDLVRADLMDRASRKKLVELPRGAIERFVVGALLSVISWWVDEKHPLSATEVERLFRRLTLPGVFDAGGP